MVLVEKINEEGLWTSLFEYKWKDIYVRSWMHHENRLGKTEDKQLTTRNNAKQTAKDTYTEDEPEKQKQTVHVVVVPCKRGT